MAEFYPLSTAELILKKPEGKKITRQANVEIVHLRLKQDETIPLHNNPFEVIFHIKKGEGDLIFEDRKEEIRKDDSVFIPGTEKRGLHNPYQEILEVLVIKIFTD